jgi:hypothetical protein
MKRIWLTLLLLPFQLSFAGTLEELPALNQLSKHQRIDFWTNHFTGTPYGKGGPLGEGVNGRYDQDPLFRFDQFDCTTFVETVTALAHSSTKEEFTAHLNLLRYKDGEVSYLTRKHITSLQWIPENTSNGYFEDVTYSFPLSMQKRVRSLIDMPSWFKAHNLGRLKLPDTSKRKKKRRLKELQKDVSKDFKVSEVVLDYLSIKDIINNWDSFEASLEGTYIINIVRPNWNLVNKIGTRINISHQGFLLIKNGVPTMIHASTAGKVVQVSLRKYLGWYYNSSTIKGINLLRVL